MKKNSSFIGVIALVGLLKFSTFEVAIARTGGPGASSCSRDVKIMGVGWGHSVTCGEGYYAKCGLFKAKCIEEAAE